MYVKYVTLAIPDVTNSLYYENPFRPPLELAIGEMAWQHPGALLATVAVHAFALFDQDFPFAFVREIDPWYRWPLSVLNYVFLLGAFVGIAIGLRGTARQPAELLRRQRFTVLAFTLAVLALCAVILPTKIEGRYALPFYLLLAPPFVLAAVQVYAAVPTAGPLRLSLGAVAVAAWVGIAAAGSIWVQNQAPVLVTLRGGTVSPGAAAAQEASPAPIPSAGPTATAQPTPEIPSARYVVDLPREMGISTGTMLDVTVTNTGREAWNVRAPYPVNVSARFIAQNTALHQRVKGLMKDSQAVQLPGRRCARRLGDGPAADPGPAGAGSVHVDGPRDATRRARLRDQRRARRQGRGLTVAASGGGSQVRPWLGRGRPVYFGPSWRRRARLSGKQRRRR